MTLNAEVGGRHDLRVSVQADWACAWLRVAGVLEGDAVPRVLQDIKAACEARPRRVYLLLGDATYGQEDLEQLLGEAMVLTRASHVKLVTRGIGKPGWRRLPVRRRPPANARYVHAAA